MEKELEGDDDNKDNDDEENRQWIEFFENINNNLNLDDEDEGNAGATAGRSSSSITIKTEEEVPDSIPSKCSMIEMEEEVEEEVFTSIINNTLVRVESTITGGVTACKGQQQVKKEEKKKKEEEEEAVAMKEDEKSNDKGYVSWVETISPNTNDASPPAASTNRCVRRKFNSNNKKEMKIGHFPTKLYRMLEDMEQFGDKRVISWSNDGLFFVVYQPKVFAESWMKQYFNQSKYKSFQRQLNFYNFQRATHGKILGVYSHPLFRRGHMETLNKIRRIKKQPSVVSLDLKARNKRGERKKDINKAPSTTTITTCNAAFTSTSTIRNGYFMNHSSLQTTTTKPDFPIFISTTMRNQAQQRTISCDYFSNNIINRDHTDDGDVDVDINVDSDGDGDGDGDSDSDGISSKTITTKTKYINNQSEIWNGMFRRVVAYKEQHGNTNTPRIYKEDPQLGNWVSRQRMNHTKGILSKNRLDLLNSIEFVWEIKKYTMDKNVSETYCI